MGRPLPQPRDEALIRRTLAGETEAFNTLIERYFGMVFVLALSRVEDADTAEDLAQEVFLRAYLHLAKLREPRHFAAWVSRIARNLGATWARRRQRTSRLVSMIPLDAVESTVADPGAKGAAAAMERTEQDAALRDALRQLAPEQRDLVLLRFAENLGQQEIAVRLGMTQSTVSRQLNRALVQMRGHLEATLAEAAPRLRAPRRATVRSVAIIAAVGAMSASSKAALAAAAQPGTASTAASAGAAGAGLVATLLKPVAAVAAAGASTMGFGKGVAAVVAAGIIIGGVHIATSQGQNTEPRQTSAATTTTLEPIPADWGEWMRQFARENPGNDALLTLVEAVERVTPAGAELNDTMSDVIRDGWRGNHPALVAAIQAQAPAMERAARAAMADDIAFPVADRVNVPVPNFLSLQRLFKLFAVEARRLEATGDLHNAALRTIQVIRLSEHMIEDEATLIQNLVGIAGLSIGFRTLESIVVHPNLPPATAQAVAEELARLERVRLPASGLLQTEARMLPNTVRAVLNGELTQGQSGYTPSQMRAMIGGDIDGFMEAHDRIWSLFFANADRPYWEREVMDEQWLEDQKAEEIHRIAFPNFAEAGTRWETAWAHARLSEAILGLRGYPVSGEEALPIDNFDGQRIRSSAARVWSVGPDMQDDQGQLVYDPTNGTLSPGDIVARR